MPTYPDFYLGTHKVSWLWREEFRDVLLFVSRRALAERKTPFPRAIAGWALDSGGFTELSMNGRWVLGEDEYVGLIRRFQSELGGMRWAAPQDWMCEPVILAKTGLDVHEHQVRTVENLLRLRAAAPEIHFAPVIQGWALPDYLRCVDMYRHVGIDLTQEPIVGVGTICRRQGTLEAEQIMHALCDRGLRLHAFGAKVSGLKRYADAVTSSDSLAWSYGARRSPPLPGCPHASCANCPIYALQWRSKVLGSVFEATRQGALSFG